MRVDPATTVTSLHRRAVPPLSLWRLSGGAPLLIFTIVLLVPSVIVTLVRYGLALPPLLALLILPSLVAMLWGWAAALMFRAARTSAEVSIVAGMPPRLRIDTAVGRRPTTILEIPASMIFCVRVVRDLGDASMVIELLDGRSHSIFHRRPLKELDELAAWMNERLAIPNQEQRIAAWFAHQEDRVGPAVELAARDVAVHASRNELVIRIPRGRRWNKQNIGLVVVGTMPSLIMAAGIIAATARVLHRGGSPIAFWQQVAVDPPPRTGRLVVVAGVWMAASCLVALFHRGPWVTIAVTTDKVTRTQQRGNHVVTRRDPHGVSGGCVCKRAQDGRGATVGAGADLRCTWEQSAA